MIWRWGGLLAAPAARPGGGCVGRKTKIKLSWYQEEPDFWDDPRFRSVRDLHGYLSFVIYKSLNDLMFMTNGYYLDYKTDRERADVIHWLRQRLLGPGLPTAGKIENVIDELVACGLFDGDLYRRGCITSRWAQECFYRGSVKRKNVFVDFDLWLLSKSDMEEISTNSSVLSKFISDGRNGINDGSNSIYDGSYGERKGEEITGEKRTLDKRTLEGEGEEAPFLTSYREKFKSLFGRDPNPMHVKAISNLILGGKPVQLILDALESVRNKNVQEPEPYVYSTIKGYTPKAVQQETGRDDPNRPLEQWEQEWMAEVEARKRKKMEAGI